MANRVVLVFYSGYWIARETRVCIYMEQRVSVSKMTVIVEDEEEGPVLYRLLL